MISKHPANKFTQDTEDTCDSTIQQSQETSSIQQERPSDIHANVDSAVSMQEIHDDSLVENKNTSMDQINSSNQDSLMELDTFDFPSTIEPDIIIGFGTVSLELE